MGESHPSPDSALAASSERLDTWKEIAAYLKRDVRTVQLWEKREALPVHRHMHQGRATVYAYRSELDAWWNHRRPNLEAEEAQLAAAATWWKRRITIALLAVCVVSAATAVVFWWRWQPQRISTLPAEHYFTEQVWMPLGQPDVSPGARMNASAVVDAVRRRLVLFGGLEEQFFSDVWILPLDASEEAALAWQKWNANGPEPAPRMGHTAVFDPRSRRMILFGGRDAKQWFNDVWALELKNRTAAARWIQLKPQGAPPQPRSGHSAAYDPANHRLIIYGGQDSSGTRSLGDVWVLENADGLGGAPRWHALHPQQTGPGTRHGHSAVYDPASNRMIVFGGFVVPPWSEPAQSQVWALTNANGIGGSAEWVELRTTGPSPPGRARHNAFYDARHNRMLLLLGNDDAARQNDFWVLNHANGIGQTPRWEQRHLAPPRPKSRCCAAAAFDATTSHVWFYGGEGHEGSLGDGWAIVAASLLPEEFFDSFDAAALGPAWLTFEGLGSISLQEHPGHLRFRLTRSHSRPSRYLVRQFRGEWWTLEIGASYFIGSTGGGRSHEVGVMFGRIPHEEILARISVFRHTDDWTGLSPGTLRAIIREQSSPPVVRETPAPLNRNDQYIIRIRRRARTFTLELSDDSKFFRTIASHTFGPAMDGASQFVYLTGSSFANFDSYADYDYIRLTKGSAARE